MCRMMSGYITWVHLIAVHIRAAVTAADAGERRYGVPVAVTITGRNQMKVLWTNTMNTNTWQDHNGAEAIC